MTRLQGDGSFRAACGSVVDNVALLIQATGYRQTFPFLPEHATDAKGDHVLPAERHVVDAEEPHLCFLGFARPNVGAIPPISEMQIMWWLRYVQGEVSLPLRSPSYRLLGTGSAKVATYGVDHGAYMHQLAEDIGAAPSLGFLAKVGGAKAFVGYTMGQAFTPWFRLVGPFASAEQMEVARPELFETVVRRGWLSNLMFFAIVVVFGALNGACWVVDLLCCAAGLELGAFPSGHL